VIGMPDKAAIMDNVVPFDKILKQKLKRKHT